MKFNLNRKSLERLKALVRAGNYVSAAWSFTADDSSALLGDPPNWTEYGLNFLGYEQGKPDSPASTGALDQTPDKGWFAYPFGKGDAANLGALQAIVAAASRAGDTDVATAAAEVLATAEAMDADKASAGGSAMAGASTDTITIVSPINIKAGAGSGNSTPTFDMVAYTGGKLKVEGWDYPVIVDLAGIDFTKNPRPILRDHDQKQPLGHTTTIKISGSEILASGPLSGPEEHVGPVVHAAVKGFPWQASINAQPTSRPEFVAAGQTAHVNGRTFTGPFFIARRTSLREISILSLGADDDTRTRIAAHAAKGAKMVLKKKFAAWAKARNIMAELKDDGIAATFKAAYKAHTKFEADDPNDADDDGTEPTPSVRATATADNGDGDDAPPVVAMSQKDINKYRADVLAEHQRMDEILSLLNEYRPQVETDKFKPIEAKAIGGDYDRNRTELELIKAKRPTTPTSYNAPNINVGAGGAVDGQIVAAAAARAMGVGEKAAFGGLDERAGNIAAGIKGLTLHGIIAMSAARLGMHVSPGSIDDTFLGEFLRRDKDSHRQQLAVQRATAGAILASSSAGFSTMSLTGITENILYKALLEAYALQTSVVSDIAYERDTNDFKPFKVYRLTASGDFSALGAGGELKAFSLQDESYQNQVTTKAALLVLKREDIINDDMGALMQAPQVLGRKAALNREKTVFTTFLSGLTTTAPGASTGKTANVNNFWSAALNNYLSTASSVLSISSLTTAVQKFMQQTDANGDPVNLMPDRLLVPPELYATAQNLFNGMNLIPTAVPTSAASQAPNINQHAGRYRPIISPFLGGSSPVTGHSATQWALLTNPAGGMATVQVGYLRGQRTPMIRQVETDAIMLGLAYQAVYDFGVALLDYRCGVYSAGA